MNETNLKFDRDSYDEVINGSNTFKSIAKYLYNNNEDESRSILIGWTDEGYDHRDILFTYRVIHTGNHQRGMRWCHFFVGIIDFTCYGFTIEMKTDNRKLFQFSIIVFVNYGYKIENISLDMYKDDISKNVPTEYEIKFSSKGNPIYKIEITK